MRTCLLALGQILALAAVGPGCAGIGYRETGLYAQAYAPNSLVVFAVRKVATGGEEEQYFALDVSDTEVVCNRRIRPVRYGTEADNMYLRGRDWTPGMHLAGSLFGDTWLEEHLLQLPLQPGLHSIGIRMVHDTGNESGCQTDAAIRIHSLPIEVGKTTVVKCNFSEVPLTATVQMIDPEYPEYPMDAPISSHWSAPTRLLQCTVDVTRSWDVVSGAGGYRSLDGDGSVPATETTIDSETEEILNNLQEMLRQGKITREDYLELRAEVLEGGENR